MTEQPHHEDQSGAQNRYGNLENLDRGLAGIALKPGLSVYLITAFAVILAWLWLTLMVAQISQSVEPGTVGPGMAYWDDLLSRLNIERSDNGFLAFVLKLCSPLSPNTFGFAEILSTFLMWLAMSLAMMLPSAAPMIRTYGDIADVAAAKGERVVSLWVLVAGYLLVWTLFSVAMSLFQMALIGAGLAADPVFPIQGILGAVILILAGVYQFSALKDACLTKCRNPFSILFGRWSPKPGAIFRLGMEQGVFCLGCCWALMLVMLVVGTMNLAWMAFFTLFAIIEKSGKGRVTSHVSGGILLAWGGILLVLALI